MSERNADNDIYEQTVPVFLDFAPRLVSVAEIANSQSVSLDVRLTADMFSAGEHLVVAQGFIVRTIFSVLSQKCLELSTEEPTLAGIRQRHKELMALLRGVNKGDFSEVTTEQVCHVAGDAKITQRAVEYVRLFGVPNFFFHFTMAYASLRAKGVKLGKAQFDGLHEYAPGFSFVD